MTLFIIDLIISAISAFVFAGLAYISTESVPFTIFIFAFTFVLGFLTIAFVQGATIHNSD